MDCGQCVGVPSEAEIAFKRPIFFQSSCCMSLFYGPCNNSGQNYIHPDRGQETHTHTQKHGPVTHIPACVCLFVWICVCPWGGQLVQNYYTGTFSPACIIHTDKQEQLNVCVCVWTEAERACFAGGEGREVSSGGNKSICWLLTEWEIKTSQWSIFITSLPLSFIRSRICFSRSHDIQLSLSAAARLSG